MSTKKEHGVHFILAGDTNKLKLHPILSLSPHMKQIVTKPTRYNPPRFLYPILTTLSKFYQTPEILPHLDNDPDEGRKPSDHNIVVAEPTYQINHACVRQIRKIKVRPMPKKNLEQIKSHFKCEDWQNIKESSNAHEQAFLFHSHIVDICNKVIPEKTRSISSDDQPWYTEN